MIISEDKSHTFDPTTETMGMGIGTNNRAADEGAVTGSQMSVACGTWFTSTGRVIPYTIKYEDSDGMVQTLSDFQVLLSEDKFYCGIPATRFLCQYMDESQLIQFWLLFYVEKKLWKMWFK